MAPKGVVFWRFSARFSGFRVAPTFRVSLTLNQGCSAALGPAGSEGLHYPLLGPLVLASTTAQRARWLRPGRRATYLKLITRQLKIIQHHKESRLFY